MGAGATVEISVIVPALNEARNVPALLRRIKSILGNRSYEVLIIDDGSADGTPDVCRQLQSRYPVELYIRHQPAGGLSGAVLHGLDRARGELLVVMDADLQHPPERIPDLLDPLQSNEAEFVLGSRYVAGGTTEQQWGRLRRMNSRVATMLARPFAGDTRDPMSGFFALRRETYRRASRLNPVGYKIALELMCKCRVRRVREIPIHFAVREAGVSKLNLRQQFKYLDHLSGLYDFCFPRGSRRIKFVLIAGCGWIVAFGMYVRLVARDINPVLAPAIAFAAAALMTTLFFLRSLRLSGKSGSAARVWLDFILILLGEWSACTLAARWIAYQPVRTSVVQVFAVSFGAATLVRYILRKSLDRGTAARLA